MPPQLEGQQRPHGAADGDHGTAGHVAGPEQAIDVHAGQIVREEEEASEVARKAAL